MIKLTKPQLEILVKAWGQLMEVDPNTTDPEKVKAVWDEVTDDLGGLLQEIDG